MHAATRSAECKGPMTHGDIVHGGIMLVGMLHGGMTLGGTHNRWRPWGHAHAGLRLTVLTSVSCSWASSHGLPLMI